MSFNFANSWQNHAQGIWTKHIYTAHHIAFYTLVLYLVETSNGFWSHSTASSMNMKFPYESPIVTSDNYQVTLTVGLIHNKMPRYRRDDRAMPLYISMRQRAVSLPQHAFLVGLCVQTAVNYLSTTLGSMWAGTLSYLAVKLFSKNSNLCDHGT